MKKRFWAIRGYDSTEKIYENFVPLSYFTERQIQQALRALAVRAGLEFEEIIGAYARRKSPIANNLLAVQGKRSESQYCCGENPHFVAQVVNGNHRRVDYPRLDQG